MSTGEGNDNQAGSSCTGSSKKVNFCGMRDGYDSDDLVSSSVMGDDVDVDGQAPLLANQSPVWELPDWEESDGNKAEEEVGGQEKENVEVDVTLPVAGSHSGNSNHNGTENENQIKKGIHALKRMMEKIKKNSKRKKKEDATEESGNCNGNNGDGNAEAEVNPQWAAMEDQEVDLMGGAAGGWAVEQEDELNFVDVE